MHLQQKHPNTLEELQGTPFDCKRADAFLSLFIASNYLPLNTVKDTDIEVLFEKYLIPNTLCLVASNSLGLFSPACKTKKYEPLWPRSSWQFVGCLCHLILGPALGMRSLSRSRVMVSPSTMSLKLFLKAVPVYKDETGVYIADTIKETLCRVEDPKGPSHIDHHRWGRQHPQCCSAGSQSTVAVLHRSHPQHIDAQQPGIRCNQAPNQEGQEDIPVLL